MLKACVINGKGGCGKTTIATHLAAAYASSGLNAQLVDLDPLQGASAWHKRRAQKNAAITLTNWKQGVDAVPPGTQRVIIDCPASMRRARVREAIRDCDVVIVPLLPSIFDQQATKRFMRRIRDAVKRSGRPRPILIVSNRFRPRSPASTELDAFITNLYAEPVTHIPDRSIYPQLAVSGLTIFDTKKNLAVAQQRHWMPLLESIEAIAAGRDGGKQH